MKTISSQIEEAIINHEGINFLGTKQIKNHRIWLCYIYICLKAGTGQTDLSELIMSLVPDLELDVEVVAGEIKYQYQEKINDDITSKTIVRLFPDEEQAIKTKNLWP